MALQFCRHCTVVMVRHARIAFVRFGRGNAFVSMVGVPQSIPDLAAKGVNGCIKIDQGAGMLEAFFQRVTQSTLLAELAEAFDIVVDERRTAEYRCELEFVAALIEWGGDPLPTLRELIAYDRGAEDAERSIEPRLRAARDESAAWSVAHVARLSAEVDALRETVDRQRAELNKRPVDNRAFERAERQRAADLGLVQSMAADWETQASAYVRESTEIAYAAAKRITHMANAARLIEAEIREREVVK